MFIHNLKYTIKTLFKNKILGCINEKRSNGHIRLRDVFEI